MNDRHTIAEKLTEYLRDFVRETPATYDFNSLDSLSVINLIVFLENEFKIKVQMDDLIPVNVGNFDGLIRYVENRSGSV